MGFIKKLFGIHDVTEKALISMLKDIHILSKLPEKRLYELSKKFKLEKYDAGDFIIKEGTAYNKIGLLESGEINVLKNTAEKNIQLGKIQKGEIFGEMAYFTKSLPMANIVCTVNCIVWEVSYNDFTQVIVDYPEIFEEIKKIMIARSQSNIKIVQQKQAEQKQFDIENKEESSGISTIKISI